MKGVTVHCPMSTIITDFSPPSIVTMIRVVQIVVTQTREDGGTTIATVPT